MEADAFWVVETQTIDGVNYALDRYGTWWVEDIPGQWTTHGDVLRSPTKKAPSEDEA